MNTLRGWLPSILLVVGTGLFLTFTLRGLGPSGSGVGPMLAMQSAWLRAPAIHASGIIVQEQKSVDLRNASSNSTQATRFDFWRAAGSLRRLAVYSPGAGGPDVIVLTPERGMQKPWGGILHTSPHPESVDLFPLPDPDSDDLTYYRHARVWRLGSPETVHGVLCDRIVGEAANAQFSFYVDRTNHFPHRIEIRRDTTRFVQHLLVDVQVIESQASAPPGLFEKP